MTYYVVKVAVSAILIVLVSEVAKRNTALGALLLSLPLVSLFTILWIYFETKDINKISTLAKGTFWLVLPSLVFFVLLPAMLKAKWDFYTSITTAVAGTVVSYLGMIALLKRFGISL